MKPACILDAAAALAHAVSMNGAYPRHERCCDGYYLRMGRIDGQARLIVAHRDRLPSAEECLAIAEAAGAPDGCEPVRTVVSIASQDGINLRWPGWVIGWREIV